MALNFLMEICLVVLLDWLKRPMSLTCLKHQSSANIVFILLVTFWVSKYMHINILRFIVFRALCFFGVYSVYLIILLYNWWKIFMEFCVLRSLSVIIFTPWQLWFSCYFSLFFLRLLILSILSIYNMQIWPRVQC